MEDSASQPLRHSDGDFFNEEDRRHAMLNRRDFIPLAVTSGLAAVGTQLSAKEVVRFMPEVCIDTEHFQKLSIAELCRVFRRIGASGLDLTVRPGGHIEPKDAQDQLPKAAQIAREHGLLIMMLTTGITTPEGHSEGIVATCRKPGIDRIKLG